MNKSHGHSETPGESSEASSGNTSRRIQARDSGFLFSMGVQVLSREFGFGHVFRGSFHGISCSTTTPPILSCAAGAETEISIQRPLSLLRQKHSQQS
jgi:hypothetical protein